ncbi:MAG: LemA family protein [Armatimonadetes bacterium]|nr:LemA family protein [Armatimonadota bacterium]
MWIALVLIGIVLAYVVITFNSFISLKNRARNAWADIDVQLKRRHDLIPNLVAVVQGYASHEKSVFEDVARLRSRAMGLENASERDETESQLAGAIKSIFAIAEAYPELKADKNFRDLQAQLAEVEDHIQYARRYYNAVVRDLNTKREMFPSSLIAAMAGVRPLPYFQVADEEREALKIDMTGEKDGV